jgi:SAM-dependent methyltransferase
MKGLWFASAASSRRDFVRRYLVGRRVLDIGNIGNLKAGRTPLFKDVTGLTVVGLDIDLDAIATSRYPLQIAGSALALPFADGVFDTVYAGEVLEHLWDPFLSVREMGRVLRNGGRLILDTPNPLALERLVRWVLLGHNTVGDRDHKILYEPAVLKGMLEHAGFTVIELTSDSKLPLGRAKLDMLSTLPGMPRLGSHLCIAADKQAAP